MWQTFCIFRHFSANVRELFNTETYNKGQLSYKCNTNCTTLTQTSTADEGTFPHNKDTFLQQIFVCSSYNYCNTHSALPFFTTSSHFNICILNLLLHIHGLRAITVFFSVKYLTEDGQKMLEHVADLPHVVYDCI